MTLEVATNLSSVGFTQALEHATRRSRRLAPLAFLGVIAVILSLGGLYWQAQVNLADARNQAKVAKENSEVVSARLERVRAAYAARNFAQIEVELGLLVKTTETIAQNPTQEITASQQQLSDAQARQIAVERPVYSIPKLSDDHDQRVFIQFAGNLTRAKTTALNQSLRDAGWKVEGSSGERIATADGLHEVRYSGDNGEAAAALAEAINAASVIGNRVEAREVKVIGRRDLEIWISG